MNSKFKLLFFLVGLLFCINGVIGPNVLGEVSNELFIYPLFFLVFSLLYRVGVVPVKDEKYILVFLVPVVVVSFLIVTLNGYSSSFKGQIPIYRLLSQGILLTFFSIVCVVVSKGFTSGYLSASDLSRGYLWGFYVFCMFSFLEILSWFGYDGGVSQIFNSTIRVDDYYSERLRGSQYEPPAAGMFLSIVFPWIYERSNRNIFVLLFFLILIYLTNSRAAILFLVVAFLGVILTGKKITLATVLKFCFIFLLLMILLYFSGIINYMDDLIQSLSIDSTSDHQASNLARWGAQSAAIEIFRANVFFGVGLGQAGFYLPDHYPSWAMMSWNVRNWVDPFFTEWPPIFSLYARLLSETGISGVLFFVLMVSVGLRRCFSNGKVLGIHFVCMRANFITSVLIFLQYGSFRFLPFWLSLAYLLSLRDRE